MPSQKIKENELHNSDLTIQEEYNTQQALFEAQPVMVKRFLEAQAQKLAESIRKKQSQASFTLPDKVAISPDAPDTLIQVPMDHREHVAGGVFNRLKGADIRMVLHEYLCELEGSSEITISVSARLIQHVTTMFMVYSMLPSGRSVVYHTIEGEDLPTVPAEGSQTPESAITQASDAIVEDSLSEENRGELQVPFVPYARRFYLPQWMAFDDAGKMLVNSLAKAESYLVSMQSYLAILHAAVSLAPYIVADLVYQQKRGGILGQLVNQGRALALFQVMDMIRIISERASANDLNRGLSLSVPYFDDQALELHTRDFVVIPAGRIMFVPAFVVRASREEQAKVAQDTRLSPSTRKYLLIELKALEKAFYKPTGK